MYNPQAFPTPTVLAPDGSIEQHGNPGMTLRDYFAAQAMVGILATYANPATTKLPDANRLAKWSVEYADALIGELAAPAYTNTDALREERIL